MHLKTDNQLMQNNQQQTLLYLLLLIINLINFQDWEVLHHQLSFRMKKGQKSHERNQEGSHEDLEKVCNVN